MGLKKVLGKGVLMLTGYATVVASGFAIGVGGAAEAAGPRGGPAGRAAGRT